MTVNIAGSQKAMDQTEYTGSNFWKPKAGDNVFVDNFVRLTPPHESLGDKLFQPVALHWPPQGASWDAFICPRAVNSTTCPVCDAGFSELRRLKGEMDEKSAKSAVRHYWPSWTYYFGVVLMNKDGTPADETPKILSANKDLASLLLDMMKDTSGCPGCEDDGDHLGSCHEFEDEQGRFVDFTDAEEGFLLNIRVKSHRDGEWLKHDYAIKKHPKPTAFDYPEILAQAADPTTLNRILDVDGIQALLSPEGQLLIGAPPEPASDPLALKEPDAIKQPDDDGWGEDSPKETAETEKGEEAGTEGQAATPAEEPAEDKPPAKKETAAAKKKRLAAETKAAAETPDEQRQRLREELTKQPE